MIATIAESGILVFDLDIQSPFDWIDCLRSAFPGMFYAVGCYGQYENCIVSYA